MEILSVQNLSKRYEKFTLEDVSFSLDAGYIMGFIGRNGAGKTTTLKSMLGLVRPDSGTVRMFGRDFRENELFCRQNCGIVLGEFDYYIKKRLRTISDVTRRFYTQWDDAIYSSYMKKFDLDPDKRVDELSAGMRVKYSLALALSHGAKLLILDEPTSGLDPVSREELLEIFQEIIETGERSILFSTHITSDLEKCADYIMYIKDGRLLAFEEKEAFLESYLLVSGKRESLTETLKQKLLGYRENAFGFTGLMLSEDRSDEYGVDFAPSDIESVMIYREKEANI